MRSASPIDLVELAVAAMPDTPVAGTYGLVAADSIALGSEGVDEVVARAVSRGRWHRSGRDYIAAGGGLHTIVLTRAEDNGAPCRCWVIDGWSLVAAHGAGADLRGAGLRGAQLHGARLHGALLDGADLTGADLTKADLSAASLTGASLAGASMMCGSLNAADLTETDLARADLRHVDLREAACVRTAFRGADVWGAYVWDVDLSEAFVAGADFGRADHLSEGIARDPAGASAREPLRG